jgi:hypothetical protein
VTLGGVEVSNNVSVKPAATIFIEEVCNEVQFMPKMATGEGLTYYLQVNAFKGLVVTIYTARFNRKFSSFYPQKSDRFGRFIKQTIITFPIQHSLNGIFNLCSVLCEVQPEPYM